MIVFQSKFIEYRPGVFRFALDGCETVEMGAITPTCGPFVALAGLAVRLTWSGGNTKQEQTMPSNVLYNVSGDINYSPS